MPTPLVHQIIGDEAYGKLSAEERTQDIELFYATNRPSQGPETATEYTNGIVNTIHLGKATVRFGNRGMQWRDVVRLSTADERRVEIPLTLTETRQLDSLPRTNGALFASTINEQLQSKRYQDITIYVHGAKSTFLRSCVQGAQFHHFMTRENVFIAFSWPSTGKFLSYKRDVEFAAMSAPALADLIEYLAQHTRAKRINILGYSAGGQVVGPGLEQLRKRYSTQSASSLRHRFRIGEVYLAAADVGLRKFATEQLPSFADMVGNVTVTFHREDSILRFAQRAHDGEARLGRPDGGVLTESEIRELEALARETKLDVIDMEYSTTKRPLNFRAHAHWYSNEWVSSDAILQFLFDESPAVRGLKKKPESEAWYFPPDYPDHLEEIVRKGRAKRSAQSRLKN